jgi:hypothetical protein
VGPHGQKTEQHCAAFGGEFIDGVAARFVEDALDDLVLQFGCELRVGEG